MKRKDVTERVKLLFKGYMLQNGDISFKELARQTGIDYHTLLDHLKHPELFRVIEIREIHKILNFNQSDLVFLITLNEN